MQRLILALLLACLWAVGAAHAAPQDPHEDPKTEPAAKAAEPCDGEKAGKEEVKYPFNASHLSVLKARNIGPAKMSGRISDVVIDPRNRNVWYVAVASGNLWKTVNAGTTWKPIFDGYGSYSIGCVTLDPRKPDTVWVGTGENNSQRSVAFGDGVYKSVDGGLSFKKMGLTHSEHIGKILVDPRDSNVVYVAAQGPLWKEGGDRGLFKTVDGGETWKAVLSISEHTGVSDIHFDPRNPDVIYASSYQRRRHVWCLINGGPESAVYKSVDAGATWRKLSKGLPGGDLGRIAMEVSPQQPDVVYALVEASGGKGGFFRSEDGGENWTKKSGYATTSGQYYQELFCCPFTFDRIYSMDTRLMVSDDGGANFYSIEGRYKHVDNHAMAFDPTNPDYLLVGCDGGLYESFDRAKTWKFFGNLPLTQFYRVCTDNDLPFYNVYGGTQDNSTQGGPSRTLSRSGITNADWYITVGGDGFESQVDPTNPDIVYSQSQYGVLSRYDRSNGERVYIQPVPGPGEQDYRWNWDSPLLISPFDNERLYFAANKVFRSDDRGDSWRVISPDLSKQIDRNRLEVMGKVWPLDAVSKNNSTSIYGNVVALNESPLVENLIYAGTDDGLIQVTEDGGLSWRRCEKFPGVPELSYVADIEPSLHCEDTVFAVFNNHKMGDFNAYVLKSEDRGRSWTSIKGDLPDRQPAWTLALDHVKKDLMFLGTEFGLFVTLDGGKHWIRHKSGLPTIAIRDLDIQRRENDLVMASFGRSFYILDDYTPLRFLDEDLLEKPLAFFPVKPALLFVPSTPNGWSGKGSAGDTLFTAPNPPGGASIVYYVKEGKKSLKAKRREAEQKIAKEGKPVYYPSWDTLRAEEQEEGPSLYLVIRDGDGNMVRRIKGSLSQGVHRASWDLKHSAPGGGGRRYSGGPFAVPGTYTVAAEIFHDGVFSPLGEAEAFEVKPLGISALPEPDRAATLAYFKKAGKLNLAVSAAMSTFGTAEARIQEIKTLLMNHPDAKPEWAAEVRALEARAREIRLAISGDPLPGRYQEPSAPALNTWVRRALSGQGGVCCSPPTGTQRQAYAYGAAAFEKLLPRITTLVEKDLESFEDRLEAAGLPTAPGRLPKWKR